MLEQGFFMLLGAAELTLIGILSVALYQTISKIVGRRS